MVDYKDYDKKSYHAGFQDGYAEAKEQFEQPQGEWIYFLGCGVGRAMCSECGQLGDIKKYCGYCGAKMKLG